MTGTLMVVLVLFMSFGVVLAGNGPGNGKSSGVGDCTGPINDILGGEQFDYTGTVTSVIPGQGLELTLLDETTVTIYGIGPNWYWDMLGVERPVVLDEVTVEGYTVQYSETVLRNVAMSITIGEETIELRDTETGVPLWR